VLDISATNMAMVNKTNTIQNTPVLLFNGTVSVSAILLGVSVCLKKKKKERKKAAHSALLGEALVDLDSRVDSPNKPVCANEPGCARQESVDKADH